MVRDRSSWMPLSLTRLMASARLRFGPVQEVHMTIQLPDIAEASGIALPEWIAPAAG